MTFTVGFSTTDKLLSQLIRLATRSKVSHAYFRTTLLSRPVVVHADWQGVTVTDYARWLRANSVVAEYRIDAPILPMVGELFEHLGAGYDWGGLVGQGWVLLGRLFGRTWANPLQSNDRWYCSELVADSLRQMGAQLPWRPEAASPEDLYRYAQRYPKLFAPVGV